MCLIELQEYLFISVNRPQVNSQEQLASSEPKQSRCILQAKAAFVHSQDSSDGIERFEAGNQLQNITGAFGKLKADISNHIRIISSCMFLKFLPCKKAEEMSAETKGH